VIVLRAEDAELADTLRGYAARTAASGSAAHARLSVRATEPWRFARSPGRRNFSRPAAAGVNVVERVSFRDHHRYTARDMERLAKLAKRHGCDEFVTTAKDEVKLDASLRPQLNAVAPLRIAALTLEIENQSEAVSQLVSLLRV